MQKKMNTKKNYARVIWWWYWKQPQRSFCSVGHLSYAGSYFLNAKNYDYKHSFERNRTEIEVLPEQFH